MLQIYNTLTRQKEVFTPIEAGKVGLYVCGCTVYDLCHIGHGRTYISFDNIARYLRFSGYDVNYVRNITDVEDKIIKRAQENNETPDQLTERTIALMHEDFDALNIQRPDLEPRVTTHMDEIIAMIVTLVEKDHAYVADSGDVLFAVSSYEDYGKLSGQNLEQLQAGSRVEVDESKKSPLDFVLWKSAKLGEPSWGSPWGAGRPGWHIECSAMSAKELGRHFDIHGGGSDLQFPHHENEVAQSCCALDTPYVNYWIHTGMVQVDQEKMSKSLNNFFTIRDVLTQYDSETVRFFLTSGHYRSQLNYSTDNLDQARSGLERIYTALREVDVLADFSLDKNDVYVSAFIKVMNDDFNTPQALAVLFDLAKELNVAKNTDSDRAPYLAATLKGLGDLIGLLQLPPASFLQGEGDNDEVAEVEALIKQRNDARVSKNWASADEARDKLAVMNIIVEDSAGKTTWRKG
ncbi:MULTISPECIES: cysteine--tRNA ligase [unclassified Colwellia]|uniref:cysteine--tRNA ligase n=1 Tax=unclassified Colwellia TaxID=196834 RepID=UPI0015F77B4F|nr:MULTISPECIES: cysteine--tRNA ligase [unclassified Colwellia]MBA6231736.1 cysteine--tRNA ligase [Colwellia sp. MB02u-7]MBA6235600.1 cysteine--tRNA ligase [Colwellia sp. MB02u-11]MBA6254887.1 cysteine--tRNA ligase [Colwellia sp. MB3u-28]MBA6259669.1 cysteine--tRNA ligase [Colwellia sp. MB3u-41]MBA6299588.1 cysteine--tRNA ligase [Colwellia sp. MB3u-22]